MQCSCCTHPTWVGAGRLPARPNSFPNIEVVVVVSINYNYYYNIEGFYSGFQVHAVVAPRRLPAWPNSFSDITQCTDALKHNAQFFPQYYTMHWCTIHNAPISHNAPMPASPCPNSSCFYQFLNVIYCSWNERRFQKFLKAAKIKMGTSFPWRRWPSPRERLGSHPSCFLIIFLFAFGFSVNFSLVNQTRPNFNLADIMLELAFSFVCTHICPTLRD